MFRRGIISKGLRRAYLTLALSLCTLVSQAVLTSPANAEGVVDDQLSVVSWGSGRLDVFVVRYFSFYSYIWVRSFENGWTDWSKVAEVRGRVRIDAVSWGIGRIDLVMSSDVNHREQGKSDAVWRKYLDTSIGPEWMPQGGNLTPGEYMGGTSGGTFGRGIQVVSGAPNRLDIFPTTTWFSESFLQKSWNGSSWVPSLTGWKTVNTGSSTTELIDHHVIAEGARLDVFRVPRNNLQIEHKPFRFGSWSPGWQHINGGLALHTPFAVSPQLNVLDVFVRGTDNAVWMTHINSAGTYNGWHWMGSGGHTRLSPSAVTAHWSTVNVFENSDHNLDRCVFRKRINIATGSPTGMGDPWMNLGCPPFSNPPDPVSWGTNRIDLFGLGAGTEGQVYHKWSNDDGNTWWPSQTDWESLGGPPCC